MYKRQELEEVAEITRDDILDAYNTYYVPGNMALVVVGDFSVDAMRQAISKTFGALPPGQLPERPFRVPPPPREFDAVQSTLQPVLGSEAEVGMAFRTVGVTSDDYHPLFVLRSYLDSRLYETVRIEDGLAYSPVSEGGALREYGVMLVYADVELDAQDRVLDIMQREIERLQAALDPETVEQVKRKILLQMVQGYESNSELADYYAHSVSEYETSGGLLDHEARVEQVTADDLNRVATQYLSLDRAVVFRELPALSYSRFYMAMALLVLVVLAAISTVLYRRYRKQ